MARPELVAYIKDNLKKYREDQLRYSLSQQGWSKTDIDDAFAEAFGQQKIPIPPAKIKKEIPRIVFVILIGIVVLAGIGAGLYVILQPEPTERFEKLLNKFNTLESYKLVYKMNIKGVPLVGELSPTYALARRGAEQKFSLEFGLASSLITMDFFTKRGKNVMCTKGGFGAILGGLLGESEEKQCMLMESEALGPLSLTAGKNIGSAYLEIFESLKQSKGVAYGGRKTKANRACHEFTFTASFKDLMRAYLKNENQDILKQIEKMPETPLNITTCHDTKHGFPVATSVSFVAKSEITGKTTSTMTINDELLEFEESPAANDFLIPVPFALEVQCENNVRPTIKALDDLTGTIQFTVSNQEDSFGEPEEQPRITQKIEQSFPINMAFGQSQEFSIQAPDGSYTVKACVGGKCVSQGWCWVRQPEVFMPESAPEGLIPSGPCPKDIDAWFAECIASCPETNREDCENRCSNTYFSYAQQCPQTAQLYQQ